MVNGESVRLIPARFDTEPIRRINSDYFSNILYIKGACDVAEFATTISDATNAKSSYLERCFMALQSMLTNWLNKVESISIGLAHIIDEIHKQSK